MAREILCISECSFVFSPENVIINNNQVRYSFDRLHGAGDHMTEGALDGLSGSVLSNETFNDDGRAFLAIERRMNIVKAVNLHKTATVAQIAEWLETSPATVRRDLTWLDEQGLIMRTRGGATAIDYPSQALLRRFVPTYENRLNEYIEEKQAIGQCAANIFTMVKRSYLTPARRTT